MNKKTGGKNKSLAAQFEKVRILRETEQVGRQQYVVVRREQEDWRRKQVLFDAVRKSKNFTWNPLNRSWLYEAKCSVTNDEDKRAGSKM